MPKKTPNRFVDKIMGTWNLEVIIDISLTNTVEKWSILYYGKDRYLYVQSQIEKLLTKIRQNRNIQNK